MRHFCGKRDSVFGGQPRHAAEAVVGVVGGDSTLRRLGQPVVLVIGIGAACCPDVTVSRGKESEGSKRFRTTSWAFHAVLQKYISMRYFTCLVDVNTRCILFVAPICKLRVCIIG